MLRQSPFRTEAEMDVPLALHSDNAEDVATSSSFRHFRIKHFNLDLKVDFDQKKLRSTETLELKCLQDSQSELCLDVHPSLELHEVAYSTDNDSAEWLKAEFSTKEFTSYGMTLVVKFPSPWKSEDEFRLSIKYVATAGPGVRRGCRIASVNPKSNNSMLSLRSFS